MTFDERSERNIATLSPLTQKLARRFMEAALKAVTPRGLTIRIISGLRTYEEQDLLFAQGRTKGGRIVTKAKGGFSNHNFGTAFDIGVFDAGVYQPEHMAYRSLGPLGESSGLEWGGRWKTMQDDPHYQLPGLDLAKLRAMHERGEKPA